MLDEDVDMAAQQIMEVNDAWRIRYEERTRRHLDISEVIRGDMNIGDPDDQQLDTMSANLIQVAIEDTAEMSAVEPTVRVVPHRMNQSVKKKASKSEKVATHYMDSSAMDLLIPRTVMNMATYGLAPWVVWPDVNSKIPKFELRDPRTCYPEPGVRSGDFARKVVLNRQIYFSQLPKFHQIMLGNFIDESNITALEGVLNKKVTIVEYFDEEEMVLAAILEAGSTSEGYYGLATAASAVPVILERIPNRTGICQVVVGSRVTIDGEHRGQFDQVIEAQRAHSRLSALMLEYADQSVYSDMWIRGQIGDVPWGGGGIIQLGPDGAVGRVPPAVTGLNVTQDIDIMADSIHLGGRWPASRPGEIDQSIASAKFLEASTGMMNTVIKTYHQILGNMLEKALQLAFVTDKEYFPGKKTMSGILKNKEFLEEYTTDDIDTDNRVRVEYGLGLGRDPSQSAVLHLQYQGAGMISKQTVQENIDGISNVERERSRIDQELFEDLAKGKMLQDIQGGAVTNRQLLDMIESRADGESFTDIFEEFMVKPEEELQAGGIQSGLTPGQNLQPGSGAPLPGPPPGGAAPGVPPPPAPSDLLSRLSTTAGGPGAEGDRSFLSSDQSR